MPPLPETFWKLRTLYQKKAFIEHALYTLPFKEKSSGMPTESEGIRWIESVSLNGEGKMALFMHPPSKASFSVHVSPQMVFKTTCGMSTEVWEKNENGVCFTIEVISQAGEKVRGKKTLYPKKKPSDRQWIPMCIDLSRFVGQTVTITLETTVPKGGRGDYAWALWGEPTLLTPRPRGELFRKIWEEMRRSGIRGMAARAMHMAELAQMEHNPYQQWIVKHKLTAGDIDRIKHECETFAYKPTVSIITPVYNVDPQWLKKCIESVKAQYYQNWELCLCDDKSTKQETVTTLRQYDGTDPRIKIVYAEKNSGISAASNKALALATGEYVALMDNDDEIPPEALYEVVKLLQKQEDADLIYGDEDKLELDGSRCDPFFRPDWSPEYFLSCMYACHAIYRKKLVNEVGGFRSEFDKSQDYDLALRIIEKTKNIYHIPKILYHWRKIPGSTATSVTEKDMRDTPAKRALQDYVKRNNLQAEVLDGPIPTYQRMRYKIIGNPFVSILLPTNGQIVKTDNGEMNLLINCLKSVEGKTTWKNYEIVIGHNGNLTNETMAYIQDRAKKTGRYTILHYTYEEPFNFASKLNFIAKHAKGDHFLILNDDIEVISPEWMTALLEFSQQKEIAVVGAKLYFPTGQIQHAGVVMGIGGGASHVYTKAPRSHKGYFSSAELIRNYSVVTGACAMTRREIFEELGGLDKRFRIDYNDVDYCLRAREKGYRIVFTPYAELIHHESISLGSRAGKMDRPEEKLLRTRWAKVIENDPYYNPNLTLKDTNYQIRL